MYACSVAQSRPALWDSWDCRLPGLLCPCKFPGKNTGEGCHFLLQHFYHLRVITLYF